MQRQTSGDMAVITAMYQMQMARYAAQSMEREEEHERLMRTDLEYFKANSKTLEAYEELRMQLANELYQYGWKIKPEEL